MPIRTTRQAFASLAYSALPTKHPLTMHYVGRFAPSPTGPLHMGSLVAAAASYCDAKAHQGKWLLRIENVDTMREVAGASQAIINCLSAHGFEWDDDIIVQDQRSDIYQQHLNQLQAKNATYPCTCTRKAIAEQQPKVGIEGFIYPRTCFNNRSVDTENSAWRMHVADHIISFDDRITGRTTHDMPNDIGDFVLKRADGIFSYHLAVVVDDALQGVTHVVRGADLLDSTSRQILIQQTLDLPTPSYMHIPIVRNADGEKLSKQTLAQPLVAEKAQHNLIAALDFLTLNPPTTLATATPAAILAWAVAQWQHHA